MYARTLIYNNEICPPQLFKIKLIFELAYFDKYTIKDGKI